MRYEADFAGHAIYSYTLKNEHIQLRALNYGAAIIELMVADADGNMENVVACFDDVMDYQRQQDVYLNVAVGPVCGRIAYGRYEMDGITHQLSIHQGLHHLHGGESGISKQLFHVTEEANALHFHLCCCHEKDGFAPGLYTYDIWYRLDGHQLIMEFCGIPPQRSLMNMTSHLYVNLSGDLRESIESHQLQMDSKERILLHPDGHPDQKAAIHLGSAFDFRRMTSMDKRIQESNGYDTPFLLGPRGIQLVHPTSKRTLAITTTAPCVVLYSANAFEEHLHLNKHKAGAPWIALALEFQDAPNGVNLTDVAAHPFADPHHPYTQKTIYTFSCEASCASASHI